MVSPLRAIRKVRALPPSTWRSLARVLPAVAAVRVGLWVLPYRTVARLFAPPAHLPAARPLSEAVSALRVAHWTGQTFLGDKPCLTQAIAARWVLARLGHATELVLGARRVDGAMTAHAWLERDGRVVLGGSDALAHYVRLTTRDHPASPHASFDVAPR